MVKAEVSALQLLPLIVTSFLSIKSEAKKEEQGKTNLSTAGLSFS